MQFTNHDEGLKLASDHTPTASSVCLLFNLSGTAQPITTASIHTMDNITKARCSSNGNPTLNPSLIDQAKALPAITGATALKA